MQHQRARFKLLGKGYRFTSATLLAREERYDIVPAERLGQL